MRKYKRTNCSFCQKDISVTNLERHEKTCKNNSNPDHSYALKWRESFDSNRSSHKPMGGANQTLSGLKRLSEVAIANNLGGHTSKQKLYFQKLDGTVIFLQSSYEIKFAELLEEMSIEWSRPDPLNWIDEYGKNHRYYPDFKVGDIYVDTKNDYLAVKDLPKIKAVQNQNDVDVRIVTQDMINKEYIASLV